MTAPLRRPMPVPVDHRGMRARRMAYLCAALGILASGFARDGRYQWLATVAVGGAAALLLLRRSGNGRRATRVPLSLTAFMVWSAVTVIWSGSPGGTARQVLSLVGWFVVALLVANLGDVGRMVRCFELATRLGIGLCLAAVVASPWADLWRTGGFAGAFNSKNHLAAFFALTIPMTWHGVREKRRGSGVTFCLQLLLVVASRSVTGYLLVLTWVVVGIAGKGLRRIERRRRPVVAALVIGVLLILVAALPSLGFLDALGRDTTLGDRTTIWSAVFDEYKQSPVVGFGLGGVWEHPAGEPATHLRAVLPGYLSSTPYAHNGYLDIALQEGLVGLLLLSALVWHCLRRCWALLIYAQPSDPAIAIATSCVLAIGSNLTESRFTNSVAIVVVMLTAVSTRPARSAAQVAS